MNNIDTIRFSKALNTEKERLRFIEASEKDPFQFAKTTLSGYRKALLNKEHFASSRTYKYKFIASCIVFKQYLNNPQNFFSTTNGELMLPADLEEPQLKQKSISRKTMKRRIKQYSSQAFFRENVDYVIAIARGGIELGKMFSVALKKPMFIVDYSSKEGRGIGKGKVEDFPTIRWKNLLLVDDIVDSGHTIREVEKYYAELGCNTKSFVLYYNSRNECNLKNILYNIELSGKDKPWIVFPWESGYGDDF